MKIALNTTARLVCRGKVPFPVWYINDTLAQTPQYEVKINPTTSDFLGILMINGSKVLGTLDLSCTVHDQTMYTSRLIIQGLLMYLCGTTQFCRSYSCGYSHVAEPTEYGYIPFVCTNVLV